MSSILARDKLTTAQDPKEYLPFLRQLRALPMHRQQFEINDHLERYTLALECLALAVLEVPAGGEGGDENFENALAYTIKHQLFVTALRAFKGDAGRYKVRMDRDDGRMLIRGPGHPQRERGAPDGEEGLSGSRSTYVLVPYAPTLILAVFALAGQTKLAMEAYEAANAWQELFTIALDGKRAAWEIKALAVAVAGTSCSILRTSLTRCR